MNFETETVQVTLPIVYLPRPHLDAQDGIGHSLLTGEQVWITYFDQIAPVQPIIEDEPNICFTLPEGIDPKSDIAYKLCMYMEEYIQADDIYGRTCAYSLIFLPENKDILNLILSLKPDSMKIINKRDNNIGCYGWHVLLFIKEYLQGIDLHASPSSWLLSRDGITSEESIKHFGDKPSPADHIGLSDLVDVTLKDERFVFAYKNAKPSTGRAPKNIQKKGKLPTGGGCALKQSCKW
jgi:hypothetical protein